MMMASARQLNMSEAHSLPLQNLQMQNALHQLNPNQHLVMDSIAWYLFALRINHNTNQVAFQLFRLLLGNGCL